MNYDNLKMTIDQAETIVSTVFDIHGKASILPGESDFNFKIKTETESTYILKISRSSENENYLDFQQQLLHWINQNSKDIIVSKVINNSNGNSIFEIIDDYGNRRKVRLLSWIPGRLWSQVNPQSNDLRFSLGEQCGTLTKILQGFDHAEAHRDFQWDIAQSLWTKAHIHLFDDEQQLLLSYFQKAFTSILPEYSRLRKSIVHNDANDNNIIVSDSLTQPKVKAIIDYGDVIYTQIINDVAITCAYAIMHYNDPLEAALPILKGYHSKFPLESDELKVLYYTIAMRLVISVTKSAINRQKEPDNEYLYISEKAAWELLKKWRHIDEEYAYYSFRNACGFLAHPNEHNFKTWSEKNHFKFSEIFPSVKKERVVSLDLSVSSLWVGLQEEFNDLDFFQYKINKLQTEQSDKIIAGGYLEPRTLYTSNAYDKIGNYGREKRAIHLGIDFWFAAHTPVHAILDGEVVTSFNDAGNKTYGGLIILKHNIENFEFFTLYGHLSIASINSKNVGDIIKKGECIGYLGNSSENGDWAPHLHFQVMLSILNYKNDFPGVAYNNQINVWKSLCPDPNLLFKAPELKTKNVKTNDSLISYRKQHLGKSLSLSYKAPLNIVRGANQYLIDAYGRHFLDTVNNVAHVGHEHPSIVKAGQKQMALLNTNSRYLHNAINELSKTLIDTLPPELNVVHFVNSGSEANELAIRMAKAVTGQQDIIVSQHGYHGNTNMCVDISSYKFDKEGGKGKPEYTHIIPIPDTYRGKYKDDLAAEHYAKEVQILVEGIQNKNRNVCAFIIEPIISCGGQVELPERFLTKAYSYIKQAGGICISDEIQTGCGRMGSTFWGFQLHDVTPDIVTIGKPLGNGHPIAAVVCTQKIANAFANGMEYFNTFGGNPVSCVIGNEVLNVVKREQLQHNALEVGLFLKNELELLAKDFKIIGDVRGQGLFLGFELISEVMKPLPHQAEYLINRMKDLGILMSTDGPDHNVIKIKPPLTFTKNNAKEVMHYLQLVFKEDMMLNY